MHQEISAALDLLARLLRLSSSPQLTEFRSSMSALLCDRYRDYWHPTLHSAYRAISCFPGRLDPLLTKALKASNMDVSAIQRCIMQTELIVWVDPGEVAYRVGERGLVVSIYKERQQPQPLHVQLDGYASSSTASSSPDVSPTTVKGGWYDMTSRNGWNSWQYMMSTLNAPTNQQFVQRNVKGVARNMAQSRPVYVAA